MSDPQLSIEVDLSEVAAALGAAKEKLPAVIDAMATDLRDTLGIESSAASKRLADSWLLDQMGDWESRVTSDVFFGGWLARGTKGHGPVRARRLVFEIDGQAIRTGFVKGVKADPFDQRAMAKVIEDMPSILERTIAEAQA